MALPTVTLKLVGVAALVSVFLAAGTVWVVLTDPLTVTQVASGSGVGLDAWRAAQLVGTAIRFIARWL